MRRSLVITFTGLDRPGMVELLARTVVEGNGNWEGSRLTRLAGYFAGVLHASAPTLAADALAHSLTALSNEDFSVRVEVGADSQAVGEREQLRVEVTAVERTGIVRAICGALSSHGVSILELATNIAQAPMGGGELFRADLRLECPPELSQEALIAALEELGDGIAVDVEVDDGADKGGR